MTQFPEVFSPPQRDLMEGLCRYCGKELPESNHGRKYCSHSHRQMAYEERKRLKSGDTSTTRETDR